MRNIDIPNGIWILAEQNEGSVLRISHELLTRGVSLAKKRGCELSAVIFGHDINEDDLQELILRGADKVYVIEAPELAHFLVEPCTACMVDMIRKYSPEVIIAGATSTGRTLMPCAAMEVHTGLTADCTVLDFEDETNNLLQTRPAIGGNIMATIRCPDFRPQMATVRPMSTKPAEIQKGRKGEIIRISPPPELLVSRIKRTGFIPNEEELGIQEAEIVVCVGRGIKKAENIPLVRKFADQIGGTIGASRDVVDRGWLSYPHQIGLSGKTISPKLYIGLGVSGAIQHLAGMQTSETIIAVNSDPDAHIFQVADFGIVGDIFEVLPTLIADIKSKI